MATMNLIRTTTVAGHRTSTTIASGIVVHAQPLSPTAVAREMLPGQQTAELLYNQYNIYTADPLEAFGTKPMPDIRQGDQLVDANTPNRTLGTSSTTYNVLGVQSFKDVGGEYLTIRAQVQTQASQTGG